MIVSWYKKKQGQKNKASFPLALRLPLSPAPPRARSAAAIPSCCASSPAPQVLLTDTVGFIQKLPTHLVAAFRATLEEVKEADILIHVCDISNPTWKKQDAAVEEVLRDIGCGDKPTLKVMNKIDLVESQSTEDLRAGAAMLEGNVVAVSSKTGEGMTDFVASLETVMDNLFVPIEVLIPYSNGVETSLIHEVGSVDFIEYREGGTYILGRCPRPLASKLAGWSVKE